MMTGRIGRRLAVVGLAVSTALTGVLPGLTSVAQAAVADLVCPIATSIFSPAAPGPADVAFRGDGATGDTLIVVDSDRNQLDPFDEVNLWEYDLDTGTVVYSGSLPFPSLQEPTGVEYDPTNEVLFVSTDGNGGELFVIQPGVDLRFGTADDPAPVEIPNVTGDTEDPALDTTAGGHLYVLNGNVATITDIDPVNGIFGDGDDITNPIPIAIPVDPADPMGRPGDWEGLTYDPESGNLLAAARVDEVIYEFTTAGVFEDQHDTSGIGVATQNGLGVQPAGGGYPTTYWIADRGPVTNATTNDGALYRITLGPAPTVPSTPPVLAAITTPIAAQEGAQVGFDANAFDAECDQNLVYSLSGQPAGATINASTGVFTWTPNESRGGTSVSFTVVVTDSADDADQQTVQINVAETNAAPIVTNPGSLLRAEGESVSIGMLGTDSDVPANTLTWSAVGLPPGLSISAATGQITGTVPVGAAANSPYSVTATLTDNGSPVRQGQAAFTFTIEPATGPPDPDPDPDPGPTPDNPFVDDNGHIFENAIEWLAGKGITEGCNPPTNNRFCPDDPVTRGQMAVFLVRAFDYSDNGGGDLFVDDDGLFYENSADRLFTAGVTVGCNPPTNNRYCGENSVTRGQMAAFLVRAFDLPAYNGPDRFVDDNGNIFEGAIERLAQAGITLGCNPPTNNRFCPDDLVTRGQMAAFLKRAFGE